MRCTLLASCAVAAITFGMGSAGAQAPAQNQGTVQTQAQGTGQTTEQGRSDASQRQREQTTSPGRQTGDDRSSANMGRREAGERRDERSERQERSSNEERGRRGEHERFSEERGRRGDHERFSEERGRRGDHDRFSEERGRRGEYDRFNEDRGHRGSEGWREERRYRTERDFDRDRRYSDDRRYGDRREQWRYEDRRSGGTVGRAYDGSRNTQISRRQRARVHELLVRRRVEPVNVDFPLRIGARVPSYITSYNLPQEVHEYIPGYEGYRYFIAGDEVVIVDPDTMEIVSVIED
jgi:hypothetical protein